MRRWTTGLLTLLVALSLSAPAFAQLEQGRLTGFVTDAQGAALPGVTVTATSPALLGANTAISEADGRYLFPSLPSGRYQLQFELAGFQTIVRENIVLTLGQTLSLNMQLQLAALQETVTVSAESPIVDVTTTRIGDDQLFYCRQRGLAEEDAVNLIVNGFCKDVFRELPMEFAVEAQKLPAVSLEGAVG